jgi:V/A-type H+-transporting ATPase subunit E
MGTAITEEVSFGVQELIDKLKTQGVAAGRQRADQIIRDAQNEAARIVAEAKTQADKLLAETHQQIEMERASAEEALKTAFRDTELTLRTKFRAAFAEYLKKLLSYELQDKDFLRQLVLAVAGRKQPEIAGEEKVEVLLPEGVFAGEEEGEKFFKDKQDSLYHLVLGISGQMLREGVELKPTRDFIGGIRVRVVGEDLDIDLSDEALSDLLLKYLLPRYRAIVSGQGKAA